MTQSGLAAGGDGGVGFPRGFEPERCLTRFTS